MVFPEYAAARWAMKADRRVWLAGALSFSGTALLSQKQCHIRRPVPYDSRVSSSHAWTMVSLIHSRSDSSKVGGSVTLDWLWAGVHSLRRSRARQWGRRRDGAGVRFRAYGAGLRDDVAVGWGMDSWRGRVSRGL